MLDKIEQIEASELYREISPDLLYLIDDDNKIIEFYNNLPNDSVIKKMIWDYLVLHFSGINKSLIITPGMEQYTKKILTKSDKQKLEELYLLVREKTMNLIN